jgi:monoamine oxidase
MAGLTCAYQLQAMGYKVQVLEARDRVGGRMFTWWLPQGSGVDMGAMVVTGTQVRSDSTFNS